MQSTDEDLSLFADERSKKARQKCERELSALFARYEVNLQKSNLLVCVRRKSVHLLKVGVVDSPKCFLMKETPAASHRAQTVGGWRMIPSNMVGVVIPNGWKVAVVVGNNLYTAESRVTSKIEYKFSRVDENGQEGPAEYYDRCCEAFKSVAPKKDARENGKLFFACHYHHPQSKIKDLLQKQYEEGFFTDPVLNQMVKEWLMLNPHRCGCEEDLTLVVSDTSGALIKSAKSQARKKSSTTSSAGAAVEVSTNGRKTKPAKGAGVTRKRSEPTKLPSLPDSKLARSLSEGSAYNSQPMLNWPLPLAFHPALPNFVSSSSSMDNFQMPQGLMDDKSGSFDNSHLKMHMTSSPAPSATNGTEMSFNSAIDPRTLLIQMLSDENDETFQKGFGARNIPTSGKMSEIQKVITSLDRKEVTLNLDETAKLTDVLLFDKTQAYQLLSQLATNVKPSNSAELQVATLPVRAVSELLEKLSLKGTISFHEIVHLISILEVASSKLMSHLEQTYRKNEGGTFSLFPALKEFLCLQIMSLSSENVAFQDSESFLNFVKGLDKSCLKEEERAVLLVCERILLFQNVLISLLTMEKDDALNVGLITMLPLSRSISARFDAFRNYKYVAQSFRQQQQQQLQQQPPPQLNFLPPFMFPHQGFSPMYTNFQLPSLTPSGATNFPTFAMPTFSSAKLTQPPPPPPPSVGWKQPSSTESTLK